MYTYMYMYILVLGMWDIPVIKVSSFQGILSKGLVINIYPAHLIRTKDT